MSHTPTPWRREGRAILKDDIALGMMHTEADAAFIVRAANVHEELLAAAKYFRAIVDADLLDALTRDGSPYQDAITKAEAK